MFLFPKRAKRPKTGRDHSHRSRKLRLEFLEERHLLAAWSGDIPDGTVWPAGVIQEVTGNIHIPAGATLTIQPNAIVKFHYGDNSLIVDGTLKAQGTQGQPIILTSYSDDSAGGDTNNNGNSNGGKGDWGTIQFNAGSTNNVLDHVDVRYGGGWSTKNEIADKGAPLTLTNSIIQNSYHDGIRIEGATPTLTNNSWTDNNDAAVSMDLAASPAISGVAFTNNAVNGVYLDGGTLPASNTWDDPDIVYVIKDTITVPAGKTLTVAPDQTVKFPYGDRSLIVNGTLQASGTAAKPIIFTSFSDDSARGDTNRNGASSGGKGDWGNIQFNAGSTSNVLDHVDVRYGGGWSTTNEIADKAAPLTLTNSIIQNSYHDGIRIEGATPTLTNNSWTDNNDAAVSMNLAASPAISGVAFTNNAVNGVYLDGGTLPASNTWDDPDIVYVVRDTITVPAGKTLTVAPDQTVKFPYGDRSLIVNGTLQASGTPAKPIIFTSFGDDSARGDTNRNGNSSGGKGDWGNIQFNAGSTSNVLDHVDVRYGGGWSTKNEIADKGAPLTLTNSIIQNSYHDGIRIEGATPTLTNNSWTDNNDAAVSMDLTASPAISGVAFTNNGVNGAYLDSGTLPADNTWDNPDIVYWVSNTITVPAGKTLTVGPGQILKFPYGDRNLIVDGTLHAAGTLGKPVIFTGGGDDSAGGDTNRNGASGGIYGEWGTIQFGAGSTGNLLSRVEVRFAGGWSSSSAITANGGAARIQFAKIRNSYTNAILATSQADVSVSSSLITSNNRAGLRAESGAVITAINNTIDGNERGSYIDGAATLVTLTNNLITNNGANGVYSTNRGVASLAYNDVFNPSTGPNNFSGLPIATGKNGNVSVDPKFVDRSAGDFHLQSSSPLIDAAASDGAPASDLDFNSRIDQASVANSGGGASPFYDLGAYEYGGLPRAVEHEPMGTVAGPVGSVVFTFRGAMDTSSFSLASDVVSFNGPDGSIAPYAFHWRNAYQLQVDFPPQGRAGDYSLVIGPNILDASSHAMDQDGDGSFGTIPGDRYNATWTITPPRIVQQTPNNFVSGTVDHFTFTFDRPMDTTTFALADDIVKFTGPGGNLTATGFNWTDPKTLTVSFAPQTELGFYEMDLSPQIVDVSENTLDQNGNRVGGELPGDQYKASFTLANILFVSGAITQNTAWGGLIVVQADVTVDPGVTLTVAPGTIVKFADATSLTVLTGATLVASGTAAQPIYFTSLHDDSIGGDVDQNGSLVGPSAGDWGQINNKGTASFDHAQVLYGSGIGNTGLNSGAVRNEGGSLTFANSLISQAFYDGLDAVGGTIAMISSFVIGADRGVVSTLGGSTITIVNSTIDDNRIGVFAHAGGAVTVKNSIVSDSLETGILTDSGPVATTYSDVWSKAAGATNYSGMSDQTGKLGNLSVDPKFMAPAEGNYRLAYRSPVIDTADGPNAPATDFFGHARYDDPRSANGGIVTAGGVYADMGAIEFLEGAPSPIDLATSTVGGPATAVAGDKLSVQWTVQNVGSDVARGTWTDGIYLSSDAVWSTDDALVGSHLHVGDLGVNQSYQASAEVSLPALVPGNYYLLVRANSDNSLFEGQNLANNTAVSAPIALDLPELQIGSPLPGSLLASGDTRAYKLIAPAGKDIVVTLSGEPGATNELYARRGAMPSLQDFDERSAASGQTNPSIVIPSTDAGANYILVRAASIAGLESFTLSASTPGFAISSLEPAKGDNSGQVTVTFHGASFAAAAQPQLVDSAGQPINASAVYYTDSTSLSATFDLRGHAVGNALAKMTVPGSGSTQLASAFQIVSGSPGTLSAHINAPSRVRLGRDYSVVVEYTNTGSSDLLAPIMRLQNSGTSPLSFTHDFSANALSLDLVGVNSSGPAGILPAGASGRIEVFAHSTGPGNSADNFQLTVGNYPATPIDWDSIDSQIRPPSIDDPSWALLLGRLKANIGANWSDYQRAISNDATLLPAAKGLNYSLRDDVQLEYDKAYSELNQSLSGRLFQAGSLSPVSGATITLTDEAAGQSFDAISLTDGSFLIQSIVPGTYDVSVDGFVLTTSAQIIVSTSDVNGVALVANVAGKISGEVVANNDGTPVPGALVFASSDQGAGFSTYADGNANFSFDSLPPGVYQISTPAGQYTAAAVTGLNIDIGTVRSNVNLAVGVGGTLQGKVVGPGGAVAAATVTAIDASGIGISATTSNTGDYTITGLAGGTYTVLASAAGFARAEVDNIALPPGGNVGSVNLTLGTAGTITGTVTQLSGGAPVGSVLISATNAAGTYSAISGDDGSYTIADIPPGSYTVSIQDDALMSVSSSASVATNATTSLPLNVVPRGSVSGTVTNSINGLPIAHVVVHAAGAKGTAVSAVTDATGSYQLTGLDADSYLVGLSDASSPGVVSSQVTISPATPTATANFSAAVAGIISGTVFAADGTTPLSDIVVGLVEGATPVQNMTTDDQGHYSFILVSAGTFSVEAGGGGLAFPTKSNLVVSGGVTLSGQNFVAGHEALSGVIKDATTSQPLEGATVRVSRTDGVVSVKNLDEFVTDADGAYSISGAMAGTYRVTAMVDGYAIGIQTVTVASGVSAKLDIPLVKESVIHGTVRDSSTNLPLGNAAVTITSTTGAVFGFSLVTDDSGNYEMHQLPAGSYSLIVRTGGYATSVTTNIVLAAQQDLASDVALVAAAQPVQGTMTNAAGPIAGASVIAMDAGGIVVGTARTVADGSYSLTTLAAGTYSVVGYAAGHRLTGPTTITVPAAGLQGVNFTLVAVALIDPPEVGEGEQTSAGSSNGGVANLFFDPAHAKTARLWPDPIARCPDGTTFDDHANADAVAAAFKQWKDLYDATAKVREQAPKILADVESKLAAQKASLQQLQKELKTAGGIVSKIPFKQKVKDKVLRGLGLASKVFDTALQTIDTMAAELNTFRNQPADGSGRDAASASLLNLLSQSQRVTDVLRNANLAAALIDDPQISIPGDIFGILEKEITDEITTVRNQVHDISVAANDLAKSTQDLRVLNSVSLVLEAAKDNYEAVYRQAVASRQKSIAARCPCTTKAPSGNSSQSIAPQSFGPYVAATTSSGASGEDSGVPICKKCDPPPAPIGPPPSSTTANTTSTDKPTSSDPNDKIGPIGFGPNHVVAAGTMPYLIEFENAASAGATVPAQQVVVTDTLDPNVDLQTVQFTSFGFGGRLYTLPPGLSNYSTTIDLRPSGTNLLVTVAFSVNPATRVLTAVFGSLDPLTLLPPDDVDSGFLPVNDAFHRGEGFFTYQVQPVSNIASGTVITNQASIVFDTNAPILTPTTTNTIDIHAPTSYVVPLTPKENDSFKVKWTGSDDTGGAGIGRYDVYVSDNGGPLTPWQMVTTASSALYSGALAGHTYAFYVVAADNVGHLETMHAAADSQTTISANPWQNAENRFDVNHDSFIAPNDALTIINYINAFGSKQLPTARGASDPFLDSTGDTFVAPGDALDVINIINAGQGGAVGGEADPDFGQVSGASAAEIDELLALLAFDLATQSKRRP